MWIDLQYSNQHIDVKDDPFLGCGWFTWLFALDPFLIKLNLMWPKFLMANKAS